MCVVQSIAMIKMLAYSRMLNGVLRDEVSTQVPSSCTVFGRKLNNLARLVHDYYQVNRQLDNLLQREKINITRRW